MSSRSIKEPKASSSSPKVSTSASMWDKLPQELVAAIGDAKEFWTPKIEEDLQKVRGGRSVKSFTLRKSEVISDPCWVKCFKHTWQYKDGVQQSGILVKFQRTDIEDNKTFHQVTVMEDKTGKLPDGLTYSDYIALFYDEDKKLLRCFLKLPANAHGQGVIENPAGCKMREWEGYSCSLMKLSKLTPNMQLAYNWLEKEGFTAGLDENEKARSIFKRLDPPQTSFSLHVVKTLSPEHGIELRNACQYPAVVANPFDIGIRCSNAGPKGETLTIQTGKSKPRLHLLAKAPVMDDLVKEGKLEDWHVLPVIVRYDSKDVVFKCWIMEKRRFVRCFKSGSNGGKAEKEWKIARTTLAKHFPESAIFQNDVSSKYYKSFEAESSTPGCSS